MESLWDTPAFSAVYEGLSADVVGICERERQGLQEEDARHLQTVRGHLSVVRDALAPSGRFKAWCAAGLSRNTAYTRLRRELEASGHVSTNTRSAARPQPAQSAPPEGEEPADPDPDGDKYARQIILTLTRKQRVDVGKRLEAIRKANGCKTVTDAVVFLVAYYERVEGERHAA
jgi:hypothetical protein